MRVLRCASAAVAAVAVFLLLACESRTAPVATPSASAIESSRPADPGLAEKYERSCMTCHIAAGSGAPRIHDTLAWSRRATTERGALILSVQKGLNAMPPMGLCPDCSREDIGALIDFMRGAQP
jgi:cytochrome c5